MAELQGAHLFDIRLQGANLTEAKLQGATLTLAQLQGADLRTTSLQGVTSQSFHSDPFKERIKNRIGKKSELSGVTFADGLTKDDLDSLVNDMSADAASKLRKRLKTHIRQPAIHVLPKDSGAITAPPYTEAEAAQWIADYEAAMSEVPKENDN